MEDEAWCFGLSTSSRSSQLTFRSPHVISIDLKERDGDDETEYPCPFCTEDFDLVGLCCHLEDEHPEEAQSAVCPVCATRVGMNMVGHITAQHGNLFNNFHKLKLRKGEFHSTLSFLKEELQDGYFQSLLAGTASAVPSSKMAPDPLLSFIYNIPAADKSESVQPCCATELTLEEKSSEEKNPQRNFQEYPLSDKDHEEKTKRCEFVQGLLLSTLVGHSF